MSDKVFVNFSNHPSDKWSRPQTEEAEKYGKIVDFPFPVVNPEASEEEVHAMAEDLTKQIIAMNPAAVLAQGEYTLCYEVVGMLQKEGIPVLAACSERKTYEQDGKRISFFDFVRYREYGKLS